MIEMSGTTYSRANFYLTILLANLPMVMLGNAYGWTSPTLPLLESPDSSFPINQNEATWIASTFTLGAAMGPFVVGPLKEVVGFKGTFFLSSAFMMFSWICLTTTWSIYIFYFARLLAGIATGMSFCMVPLYIAEVSEDSLRSTVNSFPAFFRCFGYLEEYAVGPFVNYYVLIIISALPAILILILSPWMPESPYYDMAKGKKEKALETVRWLRGGIQEDSAEVVMTQIKAFLNRTKNKTNSWKDLLSTPANRKGLFIIVSLFCFQQSTGVTVFIVYTKQLFDLAGTNYSSSISSIIFGFVFMIGGIFGPIMIKKYGLRKPLIISAIGMSVSETVLGIFLYFNENGYDVSNFFWCPILCFSTYAITYNIGLGPLAAAISGEIFPANIKGLATAISMSLSLVFGFFTVKFFPLWTELLGSYSVFWLFASTGIFIILVTVFFVSETQGLSLDQIQELSNKDSSEKKSKDIVTIT